MIVEGHKETVAFYKHAKVEYGKIRFVSVECRTLSLLCHWSCLCLGSSLQYQPQQSWAGGTSPCTDGDKNAENVTTSPWREKNAKTEVPLERKEQDWLAMRISSVIVVGKKRGAYHVCCFPW